MATLVALVDVAAQRSGSAERNISERSFLLNGERVSKPREISWTWRRKMSATSSAGAVMKLEWGQPDKAIDPVG